MSDLEEARTAARNDPTSADKQMTLAAALVSSGSDEAWDAIRAAIALDPYNPTILTRGAALSLDAEDYDAAKDLLARAYANGDPEFELAPVLLHIAGALAIREGNTDEGLEALERAFDEWPRRRAFGYALALELLRGRRYDKASDVVSRAIEAQAPDDELPGLLERISEIRAARSDYDAATEAGDRGAAAGAALALGGALEPYDLEGAREAYEWAMDAPDATRRGAAALNLGTIVSERDPEEGQRLYEIALSSDDAALRSMAAFNLGAMLIGIDDVRAQALLQTALESPDRSLAELAKSQLDLLNAAGNH
jgi:Tfp pilus assembly protein PilF